MFTQEPAPGCIRQQRPSRLGHIAYEVQCLLGFPNLGQAAAFCRKLQLVLLGTDRLLCKHDNDVFAQEPVPVCIWQQRPSRVGHIAHKAEALLGFPNLWQAAAFHRKLQPVPPGAGSCVNIARLQVSAAGFQKVGLDHQTGTFQTCGPIT